MAYRVSLTRSAEEDAYAAYEFIRADSKQEADRWLESLFEVILSLNEFPERCPVIPEAPRIGLPLRHIVHGIYRIVFEVDEDASEGPTVLVLRVRHGMRKRIRRVDVLDRSMNMPEDIEEESS
jgi:plasmid stabilization system protein ParE